MTVNQTTDKKTKGKTEHITPAKDKDSLWVFSGDTMILILKSNPNPKSIPNCYVTDFAFTGTGGCVFNDSSGPAYAINQSLSADCETLKITFPSIPAPPAPPFITEMKTTMTLSIKVGEVAIVTKVIFDPQVTCLTKPTGE